MAEADEVRAGIEERVAALEKRLGALPAGPRNFIGDSWTPESIEEFKAEWEREWATGEFNGPPEVLPPAPALTPETAGALLRECVTVVRPGETLVIRVPDSWNAHYVSEVSRRLSEIITDRELGFTALLVPGEEFAVASPETSPSLVAVDMTVSARVAEVLPGLLEKEFKRMALSGRYGRPKPFTSPEPPFT